MPESNTISRLTGLWILAVDDEPDILETIVDVLDGATVDCAKSYEEERHHEHTHRNGERRGPRACRFSCEFGATRR